jgi:hypothetical protein
MIARVGLVRSTPHFSRMWQNWAAGPHSRHCFRIARNPTPFEIAKWSMELNPGEPLRRNAKLDLCLSVRSGAA